MKTENGAGQAGAVGTRAAATRPAAWVRKPLSCFRRQQGFSLLEMIAAILLLAIAFAVLMQVAGASIRLTRNAAEHSEAAMWARGKLDSAFVGEPIRVGQSAGQFNRRYRWRLSVTPWNGAGTPPPNAAMHLYQLDLDVLWGPPEHPQSAHFRTLRVAGPAQPARAFGAGPGP